MNEDNFEQRLQRQPPQQIPVAWRAEILAAAESVANSRHATREATLPWLATLNHQLSALFWPSPKAWAGLAAVWLVILVSDFAVRDEPRPLVKRTAPPSREIVLALAEQKRLLAELVGPGETPAADRPKPSAPKPRSEIARESTCV